MVPEAGLEPARHRCQRILNPPRLPFRHSGNEIYCITDDTEMQEEIAHSPCISFSVSAESMQIAPSTSSVRITSANRSVFPLVMACIT